MEKPHSLRSLPPYQKRLLIAVGSLAVLYLVIQLLIAMLLEPYVSQKLKTTFHKSTRQAYVFDFDNLDLSFIGRKINLKNISIQPDSANLENYRLWRNLPVRGKLQAAGFNIQGIGIFDLLFEHSLHIRSIALKDPDISLESIQSQAGQKSDSSFTKKSLNRLIYKAVNTYLSSLSVGQLGITGASLNISTGGEKPDSVFLKNGSLHLRDILVDSASAAKKNFFITDKISWNAQEAGWKLSDGLYTLKAQALGGSSFDSTAFIDSLRLVPRYPKYTFSKKVGHEIDRIELLIKHLAVRSIDFDSLLNRQKLIARRFDIDGAKLQILHDKRLPGGPPQKKQLPQLAFWHMAFPIDIDTIAVSNSYISYSEHHPLVSKPGTVTFENLQATFANVANYVSKRAKNNPITLHAEAKVMGAGLLKANFSFQKGDTSGAHTIKGTLGPMSIKDLNPLLERVGYVHVNSGYINSLNFLMKLNKHKATGTVTLNYQELSMKLLKKDKVEEGKSKKLVSFIVNTFALKKGNNEKPLRKGHIEFERVPEKSIFNYWWKSLQSGLKDNIGL